MINSPEDCLSTIDHEIMVEPTVLDCGHRFDAPEVQQLLDDANIRIDEAVQRGRGLASGVFWRTVPFARR